MLDLERKPHNGAILRALVALSKALGLEVAAEGAEAGEQLDFLIESG